MDESPVSASRDFKDAASSATVEGGTDRRLDVHLSGG